MAKKTKLHSFGTKIAVINSVEFLIRLSHAEQKIGTNHNRRYIHRDKTFPT